MSDTTSAHVGTDTAGPVISVGPVTLTVPGRGQDLHVRVSAPTTGHRLPVVVFSHGMTLSMDDYTPLAGYWASHGFVVVQPTHLDSLGLAPDDPRTPLIWRIRADDMTGILDRLDAVEAQVPGLAGRVDRDRVAVAGHSWGAQTASTLVGARVVGADGTPGESLADPRVRAAVLLCLPGTGGADLSPLAAQYFPFMSPDFAELKTPSLVGGGGAPPPPRGGGGAGGGAPGDPRSPRAPGRLSRWGAGHGRG
ncbi:chlorophyllase, partial [Streptomyces hygroscopicus]|uniref:alpha/beta hydrolase family protein n=1 Tax=Streptomyces hygroscopicus TaxID=1912 RepID=UPI0033E46DD0